MRFPLNAVARASDFVLSLIRLQAELDFIQYYSVALQAVQTPICKITQAKKYTEKINHFTVVGL